MAGELRPFFEGLGNWPASKLYFVQDDTSLEQSVIWLMGQSSSLVDLADNTQIIIRYIEGQYRTEVRPIAFKKCGLSLYEIGLACSDVKPSISRAINKKLAMDFTYRKLLSKTGFVEIAPDLRNLIVPD